MASKSVHVYIGTTRFVAALDSRTGKESWRTKLPSRAGIVSILMKGRHIFVGHSGHVYCLDKATGNILWKNTLPHMGYQAVMLAMAGAGSTSAVSAAAALEESRRRAAAAAGST